MIRTVISLDQIIPIQIIQPLLMTDVRQQIALQLNAYTDIQVLKAACQHRLQSPRPPYTKSV